MRPKSEEGALKCRFCKNDCKSAKDCSVCGCQNCGRPNQAPKGWCLCGWEAVPGARGAWFALHPPDPQAGEQLRKRMGIPADVVGKPFYPSPKNRGNTG